MMEPPRLVTAAWLNGLSEKERAEFLAGGWANRMHQWAGSHASYIIWSRRLVGTRTTNNASVFFLQFGSDLVAVTAAHVLDQFQIAKERSPRSIVCQIGNVRFDPAERLRSRGSRKEIDIATFNISRRELYRIGKQAIIGDQWPPLRPTLGQAVFIVGFPGTLRFWLNTRSITFGLHSGLQPVTQITDHEVICAFEREYWVPSEGERLPPAGLNLGGLSGGPLLLPLENEGQWHLVLAGVISQAVFNEVVYSTRADFIRSDATVG
jgi:hypothetical protein